MAGLVGLLRRTWHAAPRKVIGNVRFTDDGVFAEYELSTTDFFYQDRDPQEAVLGDHMLLYRELPRYSMLEGLTVYRDPEDVTRGMLVAGMPLDARRAYLKSGAQDAPDLSGVSGDWFAATRRQWLPHFRGLPLRYRLGWLVVRLDLGRGGDDRKGKIETAVSGKDFDDPELVTQYQRLSREVAAAIPSVFDAQPAPAEHVWWHWNATASAGVWRQVLPDVEFDEDAVLDESAFTPVFHDENAAELVGADGLSADNPLVRFYRDGNEEIADSYQAILPLDDFHPGGLVFPRSMLMKLADDLSSPDIVIDWVQDLVLNPAESMHKEMLAMNANITDQWQQRGASAAADTQLPRQLFQSRELAAKVELGSARRAGNAAVVFRVAAAKPEQVAEGVKQLKRAMTKKSIGFTRWRGGQKYLAHTFVPGAQKISDIKKLRHPTTSDDLATFVPLVSSQLGDPFGVPIGIDITMPGMQDLVLTDIVAGPTRGRGGIMVFSGDPGRGKSTCAKTLNYSWAQQGVELGIIDPTAQREHERALTTIDDDKKLVIDAHRNKYTLDTVRMARRTNEIMEELARQGHSDIDEDVLPQPTDHLLALTGFTPESGPGRRFQKHVTPRNLAAKGIMTTRGLIRYLASLPASGKTNDDEQLQIALEGLAADHHLRALFDEDLPVPDFNKYQIQIWNTAWLELPRSEETAKEHLHREMTPRQRAGRAIYGLAIDTMMQQFFSRPKVPSMLDVEECYDWVQSSAGGRAAYRLMTQARKAHTGALFIVQNPVVIFERVGAEFVTQKMNFGFKSGKMARQVLEEWCGRDLDRHPDLLRQYTHDTSPVMRVNRRNRRLAHLHGMVVPGKEGQAWLLDEVDNFGKLQCLMHPDPLVQAHFDTNPMTAQEAV